MKKKRLLALMLLGLLSGCAGTAAPSAAPAEEKAAETPLPAEEEYSLPLEEGCRQLSLYWKSPTDSYDDCDIWVWYPGKDGHGELFHPCAYGGKVVLNVPKEVEEVGFIVRRECSAPGGSSLGQRDQGLRRRPLCRPHGRAYGDLSQKRRRDAVFQKGRWLELGQRT